MSNQRGNKSRGLEIEKAPSLEEVRKLYEEYRRKVRNRYTDLYFDLEEIKDGESWGRFVYYDLYLTIPKNRLSFFPMGFTIKYDFEIRDVMSMRKGILKITIRKKLKEIVNKNE